MERHFQHITDELRNVTKSLGLDLVPEKREDEINAVQKYGEELKTKNIAGQKANTRTFMLLGGAFTLTALLTGVSMLGVSLPWLIEGAPIMGLVALLMTLVFTLRAIQLEPKGELEQKMDKMRLGWIKQMEKRNRTGRAVKPYKTRSNKIIAGVAAALADKLGIEVNIIRFILVMLIFSTGGAAIPLYLAAAVFIHIGQNQASNRP